MIFRPSSSAEQVCANTPVGQGTTYLSERGRCFSGASEHKGCFDSQCGPESDAANRLPWRMEAISCFLTLVFVLSLLWSLAAGVPTSVWVGVTLVQATLWPLLSQPAGALLLLGCSVILVASAQMSRRGAELLPAAGRVVLITGESYCGTP